MEGVAYLHKNNPIIVHGDLKPVSHDYALGTPLTPMEGERSS
jgi:hypothetical protein